MIILLVATLCKSGKAERMLKKKNMNTHEYTRIHMNTKKYNFVCISFI